jgi:8-hydroxy-5-deazaflavin:NADPH oxidoreductase
VTNIAILGSGRVGGALAKKLAAAGHSITIGSRSPSEAAEKLSGAPINVATLDEAAGGAEIVINATPGDSSLELLGAIKGSLTGKILIDVSNATARGADGMPSGLTYPNSSVAEHLQQALPDTRVVKTLNTMLFVVMVDPRSLRVPPVAFLSGDDEDAKATAAALLGDLGWPADWIEDLGDITSARGPEAMVLIVPSIMRSRGMVPFALTVAQ